MDKKIKKYQPVSQSIVSEPAVAYTQKEGKHTSALKVVTDDMHSNLEVIKSGLYHSDLEEFMDISRIHIDDMADILHVTSRTLRRLDHNERLNISMSEKIVELIRLYQKGIEVFEDLAIFNTWMRRPIRGLGYKVPFELLDTGIGVEIISEELDRLAYGVYS